MKCLITRLQGIVNADDLPIFGMAKVLYCNNYYSNNYIGYNLASLLVDTGNAAIADTLKMKGRTTDDHSYFETGGGHKTGEIDVFWQAKFFNTSETENSVFHVKIYESSYLVGIVDNIENLSASDSLLALELLQDNGKDGVFHTSHGSLDNIGDKYPNLLAFQGVYLSEITGNLATAFGKCKSIAGIKLSHTTKVVGSIEALADALVANGRTAGLLKIIGNGTITYNGTTVGNDTVKYVKFADGSYTVSDTKPQE